MPVYGLGTFGMGGQMTADSANDSRDIKAIHSAVGHGVAHIDTAEAYGGGHTEELVGKAIEGYDRSTLFITTKVSSGSMEQGYDGVMRAIEGSLKRLGTDYIDLYLLHKFPAAPIEDVMHAIDKLKEQHVIRHIGVSNFTINRLEAAKKLTQNQIVCNQVEYGLQAREAVQRGIIEYCKQNDMFITAWGPLSWGALEHGELLQELATKYSKTPYQIALNWLVTQPKVVVIPKTTSDDHLEENLGALGWELSLEDHQRLTDEFPGQQVTSERVPLGYEASVPA